MGATVPPNFLHVAGGPSRVQSAELVVLGGSPALDGGWCVTKPSGEAEADILARSGGAFTPRRLTRKGEKHLFFLLRRSRRRHVLSPTQAQFTRCGRTFPSCNSCAINIASFSRPHRPAASCDSALLYLTTHPMSAGVLGDCGVDLFRPGQVVPARDVAPAGEQTCCWIYSLQLSRFIFKCG